MLVLENRGAERISTWARPSRQVIDHCGLRFELSTGKPHGYPSSSPQGERWRLAPMQVRGGSASMVLDHDLDWRHEAECVRYVGVVDFFPARGESARDAKAVCAVCPVRAECLEYALRWDQLCGVWGGLSERERRQLRRERKIA